MFKSFAIIVAPLFAVAVSATPVELHRRASAPPGFNVTSITFSGTGCPPGTVYSSLKSKETICPLNDHTTISFTFDNLYAEAGPGVSVANNRRNCQISVGVDIPGNFTFDIRSVEYSAWYKLDKGVSARQQAIYYFRGDPQQASATSTIVGPVADSLYTFRDVFDLASTIRSPCGGNTTLNINQSLRVNNTANPEGSGWIDSGEGGFRQNFNLGWYNC